MRDHRPQATPPRRLDFDLAFACSWWRPKEPTWSYTPISLRAALVEGGVAVRDVDAQPPLYLQAPVAAALSALGRRPWKYAAAYRALQDHRVRRGVRRLRPQAVLEIADLVVATEVPTYTYQDMNFAVALDHYEAFGRDMVSTFPTDRGTLQRLADHQARTLPQLDGILTMGGWFRDYLIRGGIPAERVHAVGAGISPAYCDLPARRVRPRAERQRLLFIGGEFHRKGGDQLLAAVHRLNRARSQPLQLTIAGPSRWPLAGTPPDWVDFRGTLARGDVLALFGAHDLFVMPSRFEAYGMVFLEARAAGLPCIGRDAFAMPELIEPGIGGAVWQTGDIDDLAALIQTTLDDDALHERCARDAPAFAQAHSWARVAERIVAQIAPLPVAAAVPHPPLSSP